MALTGHQVTGQTQAAGVFVPADYGTLIDVALKGQSIAAQSATVTSTNRDRVLFPKLTANPAVAHYAELA